MYIRGWPSEKKFIFFNLNTRAKLKPFIVKIGSYLFLVRKSSCSPAVQERQNEDLMWQKSLPEREQREHFQHLYCYSLVGAKTGFCNEKIWMLLLKLIKTGFCSEKKNLIYSTYKYTKLNGSVVKIIDLYWSVQSLINSVNVSQDMVRLIELESWSG